MINDSGLWKKFWKKDLILIPSEVPPCQILSISPKKVVQSTWLFTTFFNFYLGSEWQLLQFCLKLLILSMILLISRHWHKKKYFIYIYIYVYIYIYMYVYMYIYIYIYIYMNICVILYYCTCNFLQISDWLSFFLLCHLITRIPYKISLLVFRITYCVM